MAKPSRERVYPTKDQADAARKDNDQVYSVKDSSNPNRSEVYVVAQTAAIAVAAAAKEWGIIAFLSESPPSVQDVFNIASTLSPEMRDKLLALLSGNAPVSAAPPVEAPNGETPKVEETPKRKRVSSGS